MLRAVLINDQDTFNRTLTWAENNLARKDSKGKRLDQLWASTWGQSAKKEWRILDPNFSSDAAVDAATALILASRQWNCSRYLELARDKINDLWKTSTAVAKGKRYLLPSSDPVFWSEPNNILLNPSYFAPYAFRLFAQVDPDHNWLSLVDSSYYLLNQSSAISDVRLPSDWVLLNSSTGRFASISVFDSKQSLYGYDAYRVWWRVALDAVWFQDPQAKQFLREHSAYLKQLWQSQQKIPAQIDLQGKPVVDYEATSQYAMLYTALQLTDPEIAKQIYRLKLKAQYKNGFWNNNSAYYTQNLAWFALFSSTPPTPLLRPSKSPMASKP
jgi:endoglucanase